MKQEIERVLQVLIGQPFWGAGRAVDMLAFQFGPEHAHVTRYNTGTVGAYRLHVQCPWRIVGPAGIVVAANDLYHPADDGIADDETFDWSAPGTTRCDRRLADLWTRHAASPLRVESIQADEVGSLWIGLTAGTRLEVLPLDSLDREHWRFLYHAAELDHFVVTGQGIER